MLKIYIISAVLVFCYPLIAQNNSGWTAEYGMKFKRITTVAISPDGQLIAYGVKEALMEGEQSEYRTHIFVSSVDGKDSRQMTRGEHSCQQVQFSPNGKYLSFTSKRSGKNQIYRLPLSGGEAEQITEVKTGVQSYYWSPDSKSIAFISTDEDSEERAEQKKNKNDLIKAGDELNFSHLHRISAETDKQGKRTCTKLTSGKINVTSADWSPDAKSLVFSFSYDPSIDETWTNTDLGLVPADSGAIQKLVVRPGTDQRAQFSPDGNSIAFVSTGGVVDLVGLGDVYLYDLKSKKINALPHTHDRQVLDMHWGPEGKYIYVEQDVKTSYGLVRISAKPNSQEAFQVIVDTNGTRSSHALCHSTKKMAFAFSSPTQAQEVYVAGLDGQNPIQVSSVNSHLELPKMGKTELLSWKSKDGMSIEGLLTYPVDYQAGKKYPMILNVHGGPSGVFVKSFDAGFIYQSQCFAQKGYFVLRPNPRGSSGYGKEFRYANLGDFGGGDYEDLMSGVDHVINLNMVDENRLYLMGWSYGGYMTAHMVTQTNRFKAASMGAGISNWLSMLGSDLPSYMKDMFVEEFYDDHSKYLEQSPMMHVENVKTPTQIIHGAEDLRVPIIEARQFYRMLERMGVPSELIVIPRTPHIPQEPKLMMEMTRNILRWFEAY